MQAYARNTLETPRALSLHNPESVCTIRDRFSRKAKGTSQYSRTHGTLPSQPIRTVRGHLNHNHRAIMQPSLEKLRNWVRILKFKIARLGLSEGRSVMREKLMQDTLHTPRIQRRVSKLDAR